MEIERKNHYLREKGCWGHRLQVYNSKLRCKNFPKLTYLFFNRWRNLGGSSASKSLQNRLLGYQSSQTMSIEKLICPNTLTKIQSIILSFIVTLSMIFKNHWLSFWKMSHPKYNYNHFQTYCQTFKKIKKYNFPNKISWINLT